MSYAFLPVQVKQGMEAEDAEARVQAEQGHMSAPAPQATPAPVAQVALLRLWGLQMAATHRALGVRFGGDPGDMLRQWEAALARCAPLGWISEWPTCNLQAQQLRCAPS